MRERSYPASKSELCVMIVEDNDHMRILLRTLLKALDIRRIVEFREGAEALAQIGEVRPDFIITDLSMAPMDGLQFTRSVRHLPIETQCVIPIIMVTGHTERRRIEVARDAGVNEILAKPVTAAGLFQRIGLIINRPRPFVRTADYVGPCRRRRHDPYFSGPWLRSTDSGRLEKENAETIAVEEVAAVASGHAPAKF